VSDDLFLAIDEGTSSARAIAYDAEWHPVATAARRLTTDHPQPGWAEQDPRHWIEGLTATVRQVAADQQIPVRFLRQVMGDLVRAGLADATLGRTGGYRLARLPTQISLLEVIEAVEGDRRRRACVLRGGPCVLDRVCAFHAVFAAAQDDALRRLRTTTIAEAIAQS